MSRACIFCGQESKPDAPPEHVFPEVIGSPPGAVLSNGEVCQDCNHRLAPLDRALADSTDLLRFFSGVRSKRGKPPTISGRPNLKASEVDGNPTLHILSGKHGSQVLPNGSRLRAGRDNVNRVKLTHLRRRGREVEFNLEAAMFHHPLLLRALHKLALGTIALHLGADAARSPDMDPVRHYVLKGAGPERPVVVLIPPMRPWHYLNRADAPWRSDPPHRGYTVPLIIAGFTFCVDCTPDRSALPAFAASLRGMGLPRGVQQAVILEAGKGGVVTQPIAVGIIA